MLISRNCSILWLLGDILGCIYGERLIRLLAFLDADLGLEIDFSDFFLFCTESTESLLLSESLSYMTVCCYMTDGDYG